MYHNDDEHPWSKKKGLTVKVFNNNIDGAITQLKRRCNNEGLNKELRKRKHYDPPSVIRRRKMAEAAMRWRKKEAIINEIEQPKRKRKKKMLRPIAFPRESTNTTPTNS